MAQKPRSSRWSGWLKRKPSLLRPFPSPLRMEELETREVPAVTYVWQGLGTLPGGAPDPSWSNPQNWLVFSPGAPPAPTGVAANVEDLVFGETPGGSKTSVNDIAGGTFNSIVFSTTQANSNYTLSGNAITLGQPSNPQSGFINVDPSSIGNVIAFDMLLGTGQANQTFTINGSLSVTGHLTGSAGSGLVKKGSGDLTLAADNSGYLGTIAIADSSGTLTITNANALGDSANGTTVGTNSTLYVSNVAGVINEPILLQGPGKTPDEGALYNLAGSNVWAGTITLANGSGTQGVTIGAAPGTLLNPSVLAINGLVRDTAGQTVPLTKEGKGEVQLNFANTYTGQTIVNSGVLTVGNALALGASGSANNGTIVNSAVAKQGQLRLAAPAGTPGFTIVNEFLTLNGAGQGGLTNRGSLTNTNADNTWAGPVTLGSPSPNGVPVQIGTGAGTLTISGIISTPNGTASPSGSSSLTKVDTGTLIFNNANTYACPTFVAEGVLDIRDSKALGTNSVSVSSGATLQLDVEAGIGGTGLPAPRVDAQGRLLDVDSVTGDAHKLQISNPLSLSGLGVLDPTGTYRVGALYSATGINVWTSTISIGTAGIGVALDPRPGHPTPDSSYWTADYSLTTINTISGGELHKLDFGHLIMPVANTYTGLTYIEKGWVTIQNDRSLGEHVNGRGATVQPETIVFDGAALHLRTLTPISPPLHVDENLVLSGMGPLLPYKFISQKGALMNIGGNNVVGEDSALQPTWFGYTSLSGMTGIGVEQIAPLSPGAGQDPSHLTIVGKVQDNYQTYTNTTGQTVPVVGGGIIKLGSGELSLEGDATYSLDTNIAEGAIAARNNTALGQQSTGTFNGGPEVYTQTTTTVQSGANLRLDTSIPMLNGGVGSGLQIANEQLVLNDPGQQVAVAGFLDPAPSTFKLSFKNNLIGQFEQTGPLVSGLTGAELQAALMKLQSVKGSEVQSVTVGATGTFTLTFNGQTTTPIPAGATAGAVKAALEALTSIKRNEVQTVDVIGGTAANSFTLSFNGQTTAAIVGNATALQVQNALNLLTNIGAGGTVVTTTAIAGGTRYTVTFSGGLVGFKNVPQMTATGSGGLANPTVATATQGLNGGVTVTATAVAAPGTGTIYTVLFEDPNPVLPANPNGSMDLAYQNLPQMTAAGTAISAGAVTTIRDGLNGSVAVSDNIGPNKGNIYTITFGGDLANQNLLPMTVVAADGTTPVIGTAQDGSSTQSEIQTVSVVAAKASYTLTYTSPATSTHPGATATTNDIPITAPVALVFNELNALQILKDDVGSALVNRAGNVYTITFGTAHSMDVPLLIATPTIKSDQGNSFAEITVNGGTMVDGYLSEASLVSLNQDNTWRGPVVFNSSARLATTANTRINFLGPITDATNNQPSGSDLVKRGQGEIVLAGQNTFRGTTWIDAGIATAANANAFGAISSGTVVADKAQLQIQGSITVAGEPLTVQGTGVPSASTMTDQWFNVGPAPTNNVPTSSNASVSARIVSVASDPTDPRVIYIATAGGGAWKTKDGGLTWVPLFDDTVDALAVMYGGSVYVAPSNPNVIYFATGEANGGANGTNMPGQRDGFAGTGVYRSNNGGATWTLVTSQNPAPGQPANPIAGLAVTKLIVDPLDERRIYVATANANVINGTPVPIANNISVSPVAGVYRYDATGNWFNLTAFPSNNRQNTPGNAPFTTPPQNAGPDDDYRIMFPQTNAGWSDIALVRSGPGFGASTNVVNTGSWVLYAALGDSQQRYFTGATSQGIFNAVYRTEDPATANYGTGLGPTWWIGNGTIFPVAAVSSTEAPTANAIPAPTLPDLRPTTSYYVIGPESDPVVPPASGHAPGRNEWIKITAVVTRYYNERPGDLVDLRPFGLNMNASVRVYAVETGNSVDYFPYPSTNVPPGRTGEFLDMQVSGWDGGIGNSWTAGLNANNAGFSAAPFGLNPPAASSNPPYATGRYDSTLLIPSTTYGLRDTTANINQTLFFGGKDDVWMTQSGLAGTPGWTAVTQTTNTPADYFHALSMDKSTGSVLIGSDGGLWRDTYGAAHTFTNLNGNLTIGQFNNADSHPTDINQVVGAAYNSGLQKFTGNLAWQAMTLPAGGDRSRDGGDVRYNPANPLFAFATAGGQLFRTSDGGQNWSFVLTGSGSQNNIPVYVDPITPQRVLVGGNGLLESTSATGPIGTLAGTFGSLNSPIGVTAIGAATYQGAFQDDPGFPLVTDKLSNTHDTDTVYVTNGSQIWLTKNRGVVWVNRTPAGLPGGSVITDIAVDPANRDTLYVTLRSQTNSLVGAVYRSTNAGRSWTNISGNLPLVEAFTAAVDPRSDTLYIGNDQGVWRLPNASTTPSFNWTRFGDGLPNVSVRDIVVNQTLNTVTVATYGRGVWQLLLTDYRDAPGAIRVISGTSTWTGPVTLAGNTTITTDGSQQIQNGITAASLDIRGVISDSTPGANWTFTKTGQGTLILSGTNTYGGQTLDQQGVIRVSNPNALGAATPGGNTVVAYGAALELTSDLQAEPVLLNGDGFLFNGHYTGSLRSISNNNVYTGPLTLGTNVTIGVDAGQDNDLTVNPNVNTQSSLTIGKDPKGIITGTGSITDNGGNFSINKELGGILTLASANSFGGEMRVNQGVLRVEDGGALGSSGPFSGTRVLDGAQLQISRRKDVTLGVTTYIPTVVPTEPLFLSGTGLDFTGALRNVRGDTDAAGSNDNTWQGPITFTIAPGFNPQTNPGSRIGIRVDDSKVPGITDTLNLDTNIQQDTSLASFGLIKFGAGRLTLLQANSFTGTTEVGATIGNRDFQGGSLRIENPNSLGPTDKSNSVQTIAVGTSNAPTYQLSFQGQTTSTLNAATSNAAAVEAALNALSAIATPEKQVLNVTGSGNYTLTFNGQTTPAGTPFNEFSTAAQIQSALNALSSVRRNEQQDIFVSNAPGFFTLTFKGQTTQPLSYDAAASTVASELNALTTIFPTGFVNVTSSAVAGGTVYHVTFGGTLANSNQPAITATTYSSGTTQDGAAAGANEIQTVNVFSTSGTFVLTFNGLTTSPLPFNATAQQVQDALNAIPSIGGVGGSVSVLKGTVTAGAATGTQYTITFGGTLGNTDVSQITAGGAGGPVTAVTTVQDGLGGSVTVTGSAPNYTITFGGDLAARDVPLITSTRLSGTVTATATTTQPGGGVVVSETPSVGGRVFTVTFQRQPDLAVVPLIQSVNVSTGLAVNVTADQQGGVGAIVNNNTNGPASLELDGDPLNLGASINVSKILTINGPGVTGRVNVTSTPISGGIEYTLTFNGALGNADVPAVTATGAGGATTSVIPVQNGSRVGPEIQKVQVLGTAGTFTIALNGVTTVPLNFNATALQVQNALNALSSVGSNAGALVNVSGNNTYSGTVTLGSDSSIGANPNTTLTLPTLIDPTALTAPAPVFTKVGQGTLSLPNANAYGGKTIIRDGVLNAQNPQAIGIGRNEVQTITTVGTVGAFTLTFNGQTTVPLVFGTPATGGANPNSSVQNALNAISSVRRSEIQTLALSGSTTGSYNLSFRGVQIATPLNYTDSAATVQSRLEALSSIGSGNVLVTGAAPNFTITFRGALANQDLPAIVATPNLGGTNPLITTTQDGLGGTATVTQQTIPGGIQYTVTFGGDLANMNLPQITPTAAMVFTSTTTNGSATANEVQTAETFLTGGQNFTLSFTYNGFSGTTGSLPAGETAANVRNALLGLPSIQRNEVQNVTVLGTSGSFKLTITTQFGTGSVNVPVGTSGPGLKALLEALPNVGTNNIGVVVTNVPGGINYRVTFQGALGNRNQPMMSVQDISGTNPTVTLVQDGLAGDVNVILTGASGDFLYTITFLGDLANKDVPQITGTSTTTASYANALTTTDGNGAETQLIQVTGTNGTFFLSFNGNTTTQLLVSASAAEVERALNALPTIGGIGGSVQVTKAGANDAPGGAVYTVHFGGTLAAFNQPKITATTTLGTVVAISEANDGPEGTLVQSGATLQLQGNMVMDREVVTINGLGFQNIGALNVKSGNVTWQAFSPVQQIPLFLGSNASIGTTLPTDNLIFTLPITDTGNARNLDIFGPGTVTYAATGPALFNATTYTQYTGTTTVHDGTLLLSQPPGGAILGPLVVGDGIGPANSAIVRETIDNQIADTSNVLVNSDGLLDINTHTDTIGALTVVGGTVQTGNSGHLTTGPVNMTGGQILIGNSASLNAGNIAMAAGAAINGGLAATLTGGTLNMDASSMNFGASGIVTVGNVTMTGASTMDFANGGTLTTQAFNITGGHVFFANNGLLTAGAVTGSGAAFQFGANGIMDLASLNLSNSSSVTFGNFGELKTTGNVALDKSTVSFADNGVLTDGGTLSALNNSAINFGLTGQLSVAGAATLGNSTVTMGDAATMSTGDVTMTNGSVSLGVGVTAGSSSLTTGNVTDTGGAFAFGDNATWNALAVSMTNGSVIFGDTGHLSAAGNVALNHTAVNFGDAGRIDALDFDGILGSIVQFLLNGVLNIDKLTLTASSLLMGDTALVQDTQTTATDSTISLGNSSTFSSTGSFSLSGTDYAMGTGGLLQVGNVTMNTSAIDASTVTLGNGSTAIVGTMNVTGGSFTGGNNVVLNAGNLTDVGGDFTFGNTATANFGAANITNAKIQLGTDGEFNTSGNLTLNNAKVILGNGNVFNPQFGTQAISMTNGSLIQLGTNTQGSSLGIDITGSTIALGAGATLTLGGNITANSTATAQAQILGPGTLDVGSNDRTVTVADGPQNADLYVTAEIASTPTERLIKTGPGRLEFAPVPGFTGPVSIQNGDVQVDTSIGSVSLTGAGASLSGKGTVGQIDGAPPANSKAVGTISPGVNYAANPAGILTSGPAIWGANTTFFVNIAHISGGAPVAGTDNDQLVVNGNIALNGAKLDGLFGTGVQLNDQFTILRATGFISGRFAEPFGANVAFIQGQKFTVSYVDTNMDNQPDQIVLTKIKANIASMTVNASTNPATQRQNIVLTAVMTPEPGAGAIPTTSTVTFKFTNTLTAQVFTGTVNVGAGNTATFNTNTDIVGQGFLPGGTYTVTADFSGDPANFNTASAALGSNLVVEVPFLNTLTAVPPFISPFQSPGIQDSAALNVTVLQERGSVNWSITIKDSTSTVVRTISGTGGTGGAHTTVPISTSWNGTNNVLAQLPDGDYTLQASFTDQFGNSDVSNVVTIVVDNANPTATTLTNTNVLIAPGVSGVSVPGTTELTTSLGDPAFTGHPNGTFDHWTMTVVNGSTTYRTFTGTNTNVDVIWDGRDGSNAIVPDGAYAVTLTAFDAAGNSVTTNTQTVVVLTHPPTITTSTNTPTTYGDSITITAVVSLPTGTPTSVTSLLDGNPVEFYKDALTLLGSNTLHQIGTTGQYTTSITVQTFNAGTYPSIFSRYLGTTNLSQNYFIPGDSAPVTHVVNKKDLDITASSSVTKVYGAPLPDLTLPNALGILTVNGLVNGDTAANVLTGSLATTATVQSHVGAYPITKGSLAPNGNYNIPANGFHNGTLTITKAPLTVTIDDATRPIHAANPTFTFTASPLLFNDQASVVTGLNLSTTATVNSPVGNYPIFAAGTPTAQDYNIVNIVNGTLHVIPIPTSILIGPGAGGAPLVKVYNPDGSFKNSFYAFNPADPQYYGGVRTAVGDFNRDGVLDYVVATGPGAVNLVRVIDGKTGNDLFVVSPFNDFTGGVFVTAGDINNDGADELVITPDEGGGPRIVVYSGLTFAPMLSFFGINDPNFRGGARAAVGDINGDHYADIVVSAGFQGGPRISTWDGKSLAALQFKNLYSDFFAFDPSLRNGAYVTIGDVDGDGFGDLIAGAGPGGAPHVKIFEGADLINPNLGPANARLISNFFAGNSSNRGGVRVAVKSLDNDLKADLVTGPGDNGGSTATAYLGLNLTNGDTTHHFDLDAFPGFANGVFVG